MQYTVHIADRLWRKRDCLDFEHGTLLVKQQLRREQKKGGQYYFSPPKNNKSRVIALAPSVLRLFKLQSRLNKLLHAAGTIPAHLGGNMAVNVQSESRRCVAQVFLHGRKAT